MDSVSCPICFNTNIKHVFTKKSKHEDYFTIYRCRKCKHEFIFPIPEEETLLRYYDAEYFTVRTDRGYNNYFSESTKKQIATVFQMNLDDIGFEKFEATLPPNRRSLDIGSAAGYFVEIMKNRGWEAFGIDVSNECTSFARKNLGLNVVQGDYLKTRYTLPFDLITLWATIEHLPQPELFLKKAREEIYKSGRLIISTCRSDSFFKKIHSKKWRYYNVPEHIHYFSVRSLTLLLRRSGFKIEHYFTYGSGFGKSGTINRKAADSIAKNFKSGDMIVISARPE
jgi:2-polyprenyl-3-methyl-5-hydroxy-6-metoxy-1,4-benzoquinol methylase